MEQVEQHGEKLIAMFSQLDIKDWTEFEMSSNTLMRKIEEVRVAMDASYNRITKHDMGQLTQFQVIKQKLTLLVFNLQNRHLM